MNTLGRLEKMLMQGKITEEEYKERKDTYVEIILDLYVKGIIDKEEMHERLNNYEPDDESTKEILKALENLGVQGEATLSPTKYLDRIKVTVNGAYFGTWDTARKTFVD
jgi:gamma-glutamyl-gamma-aminobutyrate hydrolase PuuD